MPLPTPHDGEKQDEFVGRCMADETTLADFPDQEQRAAVCYRQWKAKDAQASGRMEIEASVEFFDLEGGTK